MNHHPSACYLYFGAIPAGLVESSFTDEVFFIICYL